MLQSCPWIGLTRGLGSVRRCRGFSVFGESGWVGAVSGWVGLNRVTENGPVDNSAMLDQLRRVSTSIHPQISSRTATPPPPPRRALVHSSKPSRTAMEQTQSEVMNRPDQDRATAAETDSKNSPTPPPRRLRTVSRTVPQPER